MAERASADRAAARFFALAFAAASRFALSRRSAKCLASAASIFWITASILELIAITFSVALASSATGFHLRPRSAPSAGQPGLNLRHSLLHPPNLPLEPLPAVPILRRRSVEFTLVVGYVSR